MLGKFWVWITKTAAFFIKICTKMSRKSCQLNYISKKFSIGIWIFFCLVYLLIFSLVLVLSSICYCSKIIFFSEYFPNSESDFVHFRSLFLQESRDPSPKFISKGSNLQTYILLKRFLCTTDREVSIEPTWKSAVSYRHQLYQLMAL